VKVMSHGACLIHQWVCYFTVSQAIPANDTIVTSKCSQAHIV